MYIKDTILKSLAMATDSADTYRAYPVCHKSRMGKKAHSLII